MSWLVVDGNHLAGRSFRVLQDLKTSDGKPSGMILGFYKSLLWANSIAKCDWPRIVICWDGGRAEFRKRLYPEYKQHRAPLNESESDRYYSQLREIQLSLSLLGYAQIRIVGVEADDVISIIAHQKSAQGQIVHVFSGDRDMHQLASSMVMIIDPKLGLLRKQDVQRIWEVTDVSHILLLRAMIGDPNDGIDGVPRVGIVRAKEVMNDLVRGTNLSKWTVHVRRHANIVDRNIQLMRLPKDWEESGYDMMCADAYNTQLSIQRTQQIDEFIFWLRRWEMNDLLNSILRFR
ncbi:MAG: hypothetical protein QXG97_00735 [Nitrososphaerota archaeon]